MASSTLDWDVQDIRRLLRVIFTGTRTQAYILMRKVEILRGKTQNPKNVDPRDNWIDGHTRLQVVEKTHNGIVPSPCVLLQLKVFPWRKTGPILADPTSGV